MAGQHNNRDIGLTRRAAAIDLHTIHPWHLQVDQQEIKRLPFQQRDGFLTTVGDRHTITSAFEQRSKCQANSRLIVDKQNLGRKAHQILQSLFARTDRLRLQCKYRDRPTDWGDGNSYHPICLTAIWCATSAVRCDRSSAQHLFKTGMFVFASKDNTSHSLR